MTVAAGVPSPPHPGPDPWAVPWWGLQVGALTTTRLPCALKSLPSCSHPSPTPGCPGEPRGGAHTRERQGPGRLLQSCRIMYLGLAGQWLRLPNPSPLIKSCDFPTLPPGPSLQPPGGLPTAPAAELVVIISVLYTLQLQTSVPSNISS